MIVENIVKPSDLKEAYDLLINQPKSVILGGGLFLRLQKKNIPLLIDCETLIGHNISEDDCVRIGAMTSLRAIECSELLPEGLRASVRQISGIGTRNVATIGGSVCGRYPFSDINTALVALDATLVFYHAGEVAMRSFNEVGLDHRDILLEVRFNQPKFSRSAFYKKVYTDFSIVNLSVVDHTIAVGARPMRPIYLTDVDYSKTPDQILASIDFGDDFKSSGAYRRALAEAKLEDIINEMGGHHDN